MLLLVELKRKLLYLLNLIIMIFVPYKINNNKVITVISVNNDDLQGILKHTFYKNIVIIETNNKRIPCEVVDKITHDGYYQINGDINSIINYD
jgi:hypothetical protein